MTIINDILCILFTIIIIGGIVIFVKMMLKDDKRQN